MATEFTLVGPTLHNGVRDSSGGIWMRIENDVDHRILIAALKKALKNHEAATNTLASLDEQAPATIDYISTSLNRVKAAAIGALPPSQQLAGTPIGDAIQSTLKLEERPDELAPEEPELSDEKLLELLVSIGADAAGEQMSLFTKEQRNEVYRWARALKLTEGGARRDIAVPPRPLCVPIGWFGQSMKAAIEAGERDEHSLAEIVLDESQVDYWYQQGPWATAEYTHELTDDEIAKLPREEREEMKAGERPTVPEFAVEWKESVESGAVAPLHPYVYDTVAEAKAVAAKMNRRIRVDMADDENDPVVQGEPLPLNEALLTIELQESVIKDMNETLRNRGDSKTIIDKTVLDVGALRKWYRTGPWTAQALEDPEYEIVEVEGDSAPPPQAESKYRVVKQVAPGRFVGSLTTYDVYEAHVRVALMNRAEFQTGQLWDTPPEQQPENEAERAVNDGKAKKKGRGGGGRKGGGKKK